MKTNFEKYIGISEEVKDALTEKKALVALESTIISHGMPYPKNYETALEIEKTVRDNGAVPATIAIINGVIKIGLNKDEIEFLSRNNILKVTKFKGHVEIHLNKDQPELISGSSQNNILKASRRDIPVIISQKLSAATTVSATMILRKACRYKDICNWRDRRCSQKCAEYF